MANNNIGIVHREKGRTAEAMASFEQARAIDERLVREHPDSPDFASALGGTLNNMAMVDLGERRFDEARAKLRGPSTGSGRRWRSTLITRSTDSSLPTI